MPCSWALGVGVLIGDTLSLIGGDNDVGIVGLIFTVVLMPFAFLRCWFVVCWSGFGLLLGSYLSLLLA